MKSVNTFKILSQSSVEPFISMNYELMQQIQHIVAIAPKEAQWFHLLEEIGDSEFRLSEMFIPEQVCSSVEVDTDSQMMVNFWNELKNKYGMVEASEKLTKMTVWCHSHHNMAPNPSGQDHKQFYELVKQQKDAGTNRPVVMFIFNKKDDYYCRLWDPKTNLVYEGLDIVYTQYDMNWIDIEAKIKFKEPAPKVTATTTKVGSSSTFWANSYYQKPTTPTSYTAKSPYLDDSFNIHSYAPSTVKTAASCAETKIKDWFGVHQSEHTIITKLLAETFADAVYEELESEEKYIILNLLKKQKDFFDKAKESKNKKFARKQYTDAITKVLTVNKLDVSFLELLLTNTFEMVDHLYLEDKSNFDIWAADFVELFEMYSTEPQYSFLKETTTYTPFNK